MTERAARPLVAQLDEIRGIPCPCGTARRAFGLAEDGVATLHLVDISRDARVHYHKKTTEIYCVLEGEGAVELDGESVPVRGFTSILIPPGVRHRAVGNLKILNFAIPAFDPEDEWFDEAPSDR